jgi:hypothetical protein
MDAASRNPQILVSKIKREFEYGKISLRSTHEIQTMQKIKLCRMSAFRRNHQIKGDPLLVAHQAIDQIEPNITKNETMVRRFDSDT